MQVITYTVVGGMSTLEEVQPKYLALSSTKMACVSANMYPNQPYHPPPHKRTMD